MQVFARQGFSGTRASHIAQAAGVAHGTVFLHFDTLDALQCAAIESFGMRVALRLHELASAENDVRSLLNAHMQGLAENEAFYIRLVQEGAQLPETARHTLVMIQSVLSFHLGQVAQCAIENGEIKAIPLPLFFNTWIGLLHHYLANHTLFSPNAPVLKTCGPMLLTHFMNLVSCHQEVNA